MWKVLLTLQVLMATYMFGIKLANSIKFLKLMLLKLQLFAMNKENSSQEVKTTN